MELLTPGIGLIFWQAIVFLALVFILGRYAWRPILGAIKVREQSIAQALGAADQAQAQRVAVEEENKRLFIQAVAERDKLLQTS